MPAVPAVRAPRGRKATEDCRLRSCHGKGGYSVGRGLCGDKAICGEPVAVWAVGMKHRLGGILMKLRAGSIWRYAIPSIAIAVPLVKSMAFGSAASLVPLVPECTDVHIVCTGSRCLNNFNHCQGLVIDNHDGATCDTFCGGDCDGHCA
jgi:hypothetical protein